MTLILLVLGLYLFAIHAVEAGFSEGLTAYEISDFSAALIEFRGVSRKGGDLRANYMLGHMYQHGHGVAKNNNIAMGYFRIAADLGHAKSQYRLGLMHQKGFDLPTVEELVRSVETGIGPVGLTRKGRAGNFNTNLGLSYAEAERWYLLAANQGLVEAQYNLGLMYASGGGIQQNYAIAYFWWSLAKESGNQRAGEKLGVLKIRMTQDEFSEGKRLIKQWSLENR